MERELAMVDEPTTFEAAYAELEQVVAKLQDGALSLEESLVLYERGVALAHCCSKQLEQAELRVRQLLSDGQMEDLAPQV